MIQTEKSSNIIMHRPPVLIRVQQQAALSSYDYCTLLECLVVHVTTSYVVVAAAVMMSQDKVLL